MQQQLLLQRLLLLQLLLLLGAAAGARWTCENGPQGTPLGAPLLPGPTMARGQGGPLDPVAGVRRGLPSSCCFLSRIKAAAKAAKQHQRMADLNVLLQQEGKDCTLLIAKPLTEGFAPNPARRCLWRPSLSVFCPSSFVSVCVCRPDSLSVPYWLVSLSATFLCLSVFPIVCLFQNESRRGTQLSAWVCAAAQFSYGHLPFGDKASLPACLLKELLARKVDPPWQFVLESVSFEEEEPPSPSKEGGGPPEGPPEGPSDSRGGAPGGRPSVAVGALDFAAPPGYIFLPPWVLEALGIQSGGAVLCRMASLPTGSSVQLRAEDAAFFSQSEAAGGLQEALETELRHYSSLTAGTSIPLKIGRRLFLFTVEQILTEEGEAVPQASIQDTDVALQLLPPHEGPPGAPPIRAMREAPTLTPDSGPTRGGLRRPMAPKTRPFDAGAAAASAAAAADAAAASSESTSSCLAASDKKKTKKRRLEGPANPGAPPLVGGPEQGSAGAPERGSQSRKRKKSVSGQEPPEDREASEAPPRKKQAKGEEGGGGPSAAAAAAEGPPAEGPLLSSARGRGRGKLRRKREGCWGPHEIAARKAELLTELRERRDSLSVSRIKRIKARLAQLTQAEEGKRQVGGQLAKSKPRSGGSKEERGKKGENNKHNRHEKHKGDRDRHPKPATAKRTKKVCLRCQKRGHLLHECRQGGGAPQEGGETAAPLAGICFNCGSSSHTLKACKKRRAEDGSLPFGVCFICNEKGHISSQCPKSTTGKYPKGGCCRTCGSIYHLQVECPVYKQQKEQLQQQRQKKKEKKGEAKPAKEDTDADADAYWMQQLAK
ncbi:hypothetical protein Efla_004655 [Eimeria flavescens]